MLKAKLLHPNAKLPCKAHPSDRCYDLYSVEDTCIEPQSHAVINTGVALELGHGLSAQICSRSGLAANWGVFVLNAPGIIDTSYRGELRVILYNSDLRHLFHIQAGDRIAQLLLDRDPCIEVAFQKIDELSETERGDKGCGSTGR